MNVLSKSRKKLFGKATLVTAVLGGFLLFCGAPGAKANNWCDDDRRIDRAEWKLRVAIQRHGYYSRQSEHWRHELREEQERCWRERREWREHEWRERRDYDRHRYDRDRDRD